MIFNRKQTVQDELDINRFLTTVYGVNTSIDLSDDFSFAVLIKKHEKIIACAFVYTRDMLQGSFNFSAAIVGLVAVDSCYRGNGLCKKLMSQIDKQLIENGINFCFLFAYQTKVYTSSGYINLVAPIQYLDKQQNRWNKFVYRGGMYKALGNLHLKNNVLIEFKGCVY